MGQFLYVLVYIWPFTNLAFNWCAIYFDSKVIMSQNGIRYTRFCFVFDLCKVDLGLLTHTKWPIING